MIATLQTIPSTIYAFCEMIIQRIIAFYGPCDGAALEAMIVGGSCIFFLVLSQRQRVTSKWKGKSVHDPKKIGKHVDACNKPRNKNFAARTQGAKPRSPDEAPKLDFNTGRTGRSFKQALQNLERYKNTVWQQGVDLRERISDQQAAQSFYLNIVSCMIQIGPNSNTLPSIPDQGSRSGAVAWIQRLLSDMRRFGFTRNVELYLAMMKMFANDHLWKEVLAFHKEMAIDTVQPDSAVLICFMNAAVCTDDHDWALHYFRALAKLAPPSQRTYMTVLRVYGKRKDWEGAVRLMDEMEGLGSAPDNLVLNQVLGLCVSVGQLAAAETLLKQWHGIIDVISCNTVLKGHTQVGALADAETMLQRMIAEGPAPNLISFNTIMDCAFRALQALESQGRGQDSSSQAYRNMRVVAQKPWQLLDQLMEQGLEPDRYTCSTIVKGMHLSGGSPEEIDRAVALLKRLGPENLRAPAPGPEMQKQPASISAREGNTRLVEVLFNTLLDICSSSQDIDRMVEIFGMMQAFEVDISSITFGTLIKAFGQAGRLTRCHEVWQQMRDAKIVPTVVTYGCYIDACVRNKDVATGLKVFYVMPESGIKPNAVIYTSLIRGLASAGQPVQAFALYRHMRAAKVEPTSVTFNSVLDMVARRLADPENLQEVINDMKSVMTTPDITAYCILVKASCNSGNMDNAISLFRQLRGQGIAFDHGTFSVMLLTCAKADRVAEVEEIFKEMCRLNIPPTNASTSIVIKMYGRVRQAYKAFEVFRVVENGLGEKPNLHVFTCLIQASVQNKQVKRSWEVFDNMLRSGVEPDAVAYDTVINGCLYINKFDYAMSLVRHASMLPPRLEESPAEAPRIGMETTHVKKVVLLLPDVLQALRNAMLRKEQHALIAELDGIIATRQHAR